MENSYKRKALVIGSNGTIGSAICSLLESEYDVVKISRKNSDFSEESLQQHALQLSESRSFSRIICCIGVLHDDVVSPEKSLKQIQVDKLQHYFYVNSILPALCIKYFHQILDKSTPSSFACLSAMVGSTKDNHLGGWYGYRASKAALNSLVKTSSIEINRTNKKACLIAIHPGTTVGDLSAPFAKNVKPEKYYTPVQSAQRILQVMDSLSARQSGNFYNWDGNLIDW